MKLSTRIFIGLVAGVGVGWIAQAIEAPWLRDALDDIAPIGPIFIRLVGMVVVPLVVASLFVGVAALGDVRRLGRIGGRTLALFVGTTMVAAVIGYAVASLAGLGANAGADVHMRLLQTEADPTAKQSAMSLVQLLVQMIPQNPIASAAQGDLLPLIIAVCLFSAALGATSGEGKRTVLALCEGVNQMSMVVIGWMMQLAPIAVFVLIAGAVANSGIDVLSVLITFALVAVGAMVIHVLTTLLLALRLGTGLGPIAFFRSSSDALLMAFSTASSSATLPVSMAAATARLGVSTEVASFVLPLGATINKNGSAVYKAVTAVFLMHLYGLPIGPAQALTIILVSTAAAFAGAGVPASSLVTTLIVLNAVGLGANAAAGIAFVAAIDRPLDMCRATVNTLGNLIVTASVARSEGERLKTA